MFEDLVIQSHLGPYTVTFNDDALRNLNEGTPDNFWFIIDSRVATLFSQELENPLRSGRTLLVDAHEESKSLERFPEYVSALASRGVRRGWTLAAIGGGIIQDITCFLAATLYRGLDWQFYPTTLLAQADSCIGSKSSINCGRFKNVLGTFTPPSRVSISTTPLRTLGDLEIRSGIGEMLKVHALRGPSAFDEIASDYDALAGTPRIRMRYVRKSLELKKELIEQDEFDRDIRNVLNYGHSFGHAIETATNFAVPHGIAVTIGMDMANYVAARSGLSGIGPYERMHPTLARNYSGCERVRISESDFWAALSRDKKNTDSGAVTLILPNMDAAPVKTMLPADDRLRAICADFLKTAFLTENPA